MCGIDPLVQFYEKCHFILSVDEILSYAKCKFRGKYYKNKNDLTSDLTVVSICLLYVAWLTVTLE